MRGLCRISSEIGATFNPYLRQEGSVRESRPIESTARPWGAWRGQKYRGNADWIESGGEWRKLSRFTD